MASKLTGLTAEQEKAVMEEAIKIYNSQENKDKRVINQYESTPNYNVLERTFNSQKRDKYKAKQALAPEYTAAKNRQTEQFIANNGITYDLLDSVFGVEGGNPIGMGTSARMEQTTESKNNENYLKSLGADMDYLEKYYKSELNNKALQNVADATKNAPVAMNALSSVGNTLSNAGYGLGTGLEWLTGDTNLADDLDFGVQANQAIRQTTKEDVIGEDKKVGNTLYDVGMGVADFGGALALGGGNPLLARAMQTASAVGSSAYDAKSRGLTDSQAMAEGLVGGAAELALSKLPFDVLTRTNADDALIKTLLKQGASEALEEGGTSAVNAIADTIIAGNKSNYELKKQAYMSMGMSEAEARNNAVAEVLKEIGYEGLIGGLSGGVIGGVNTGVNRIASRNTPAVSTNLEPLANSQTVASPESVVPVSEPTTESAESGNTATLNEKTTNTVPNVENGLNSQNESANDSSMSISFNGISNQKRAYKADLTKYDKKQQETIKRAIESGILNDSKETHDFVDMVARLSSQKGVTFDFTNNQRLKDSGFALEGKTINGYVKDGNIALNINSNRALNTVVGHEITHVLEGTDLYNDLQKAIIDYAKTKGEYDKRLKSIENLYKGIENVNIANELTADLVGDYLFTDYDFISNLSATKHNVFKRIYEEIKYLLRVATAGSNEARQLEKVKKAFDKAFKASAENRVGDETKYSLNEFEDGRRFVEVDQEQDRFEGHDRSEFPRIAKEIINEKFNGKVIGIDNKMFVNGRGRDEFTHPSKPIKENYVYDAKMKASAEIDNLLDAGANLRNEADGRDGHLHENVVGGFDYYDTLFKVGDNYFEATINIANTEKGKLFKDVTKIKDVTKAIMNSYGQNPKFQFLRTSSMDSIPQNAQNATTKSDVQYSLSEDSEGRTLSNEQKEYFKDSKIVDENGQLKVMYHGTERGTGFTVFNNEFSDDGRSFFFTDNLTVAKGYSGSYSTYAPKSFNSVSEANMEISKDSMNNGYHIEKEENEYVLYYEDDVMETSDSLDEVYKMFEEGYGSGLGSANYKTYLNITNPLEVDADNNNWDEIPFNGKIVTTRELSEYAKNNGYDGVYIKNVIDNGLYASSKEKVPSSIAIAFEPNQIKSVANENPTLDDDIRYSLGGNISSAGKYNVYGRDIALEPFMEAERVKESIAENNLVPDLANVETLNQYADVSNIEGDNQRIRSYNETVINKTDAPDAIKNDLIDNPEIYNQLSNKATLDKAVEILNNNDTNTAIVEFRKYLDATNPIAVPLGYNLSKQLVAENRVDEAIQIVRDIEKALTRSGQFSQSAVITMLNNSPEAAMRYLVREIDNLNKKGAEKFGKKWENLELTESEVKRFAEIENGDTEAIKALYQDVYNRIKKQYPSTFKEKLMEYRRVAMLLNVRTNIRNVVSNAMLFPVRWTADRVSALGDGVYSLINPEYQRTQSLNPIRSAKAKKLANEIFEANKDVLLDENKYDDAKDVMRDKQVFKGTKVSKALDNALNGAITKANQAMGKDINPSLMETARNFTYYLLQKGDDVFVKQNFISRLSSYLDAQGITDIANVPPDAITLATQEAMKATFKDDTKLSQTLSNFRKNFGIVGDIIMPFTKTPANLAMRGIDYSPVGVINGIKTLRNATTNEEISKGITQLGQAVTGTAAIALGYVLAESGIITGALSDDKDEAQFEKQQGKLAYSIKTPWGYVTYDWAQPASIPLILGATIYDSLNDDVSLASGLKQGGLAVADSWLELSPLQNMSDIFGGYGTPAENVLDVLATDFPLSFVPSQLGAIARATDTTQRTTYSNDYLENLKNQTMAKIPGLSQKLPATYDTWGNEVQRYDNVAEGLFANMINPGQFGNESTTPIDNEILDLYEATGNASVFPKKAAWTENKQKLSAEEYSEFQRISGSNSYDMVEALIESSNYQLLDDEQKADIIADIYNFSNALADKEITDYDIETSKTYGKAYSVYEEAGAEGIANYYAIKKLKSGNKQSEIVSAIEQMNLSNNEKGYYLSLFVEPNKETVKLYNSNNWDEFYNYYFEKTAKDRKSLNYNQLDPFFSY